MPTLFILSHAPHQDPTEAKKVAFAVQGDCVLLIEDGVYAAAPVTTEASKAIEAAAARGVRICALQPDLDARAVRTNLETVDYPGFVDLIVEYERSVH
ncbi:MAG: sulfurtransferase complex subunit TusB [Armatimonadetes bacterium]|nr:sulfurtransferase complex subunit TusB [Armatimonadota bacterium]